MDVFAARQPILDRKQQVFAYELLFRGGKDNAFSASDGDNASRVLLNNTLNVFGFDDLTGGHTAFINFTRSLLVDQTALLVPPDRAVIEVLETVEADDDVVRSCRALKEQGYLLALDDFVMQPGYDALIALADFVKVDFLQYASDDRRAIARQFAAHRVRLLAEKVESSSDFAEGVSLGYELFQGYFFCRPQMVSRKDISGDKLVGLRFLDEINRPEINFTRVESYIKQDVAMSVKLLRYVNSAWFGLRNPPASLHHALVLLGQEGLRRWGSLLVVTILGSDKPSELARICLLRATFCERLAKRGTVNAAETDLFLLGLMSGVDALVDRPMDQVLAEVAVPDMVKEALLGSSNGLSLILQLILSYEKGDWLGVTNLAGQLSIDEAILPTIYNGSCRWVAQIVPR